MEITKSVPTRVLAPAADSRSESTDSLQKAQDGEALVEPVKVDHDWSRDEYKDDDEKDFVDLLISDFKLSIKSVSVKTFKLRGKAQDLKRVLVALVTVVIIVTGALLVASLS